MNFELIAQVCHEVNRVYCNSIGDFSQPTWDDAPYWQKESAIAGVKFHFENPESTPEDSHASWLQHKERDGWKYGPVKNPELKEHPCMVPYHQLPKEQQIKDAFFTSIVKAFMESTT